MRTGLAVFSVLLVTAPAGCINRPPSPPSPSLSEALRVAARVSRGEATLADLEQAYRGSGLEADITPDVTETARILDDRGNRNDYLDGAELTEAIQYYATQQPIEGTIIDGRVLIGLIQVYAAGVRITLPSPEQFFTYYVRPDGGPPGECSGLVDAPYTEETKPDCAWDPPFRALPPGGPPRISGGDTLIIEAGSYMMGYGAPGAEACSADYPWDCHMPPIPL